MYGTSPGLTYACGVQFIVSVSYTGRYQPFCEWVWVELWQLQPLEYGDLRSTLRRARCRRRAGVTVGRAGRARHVAHALEAHAVAGLLRRGGRPLLELGRRPERSVPPGCSVRALRPLVPHFTGILLF